MKKESDYKPIELEAIQREGAKNIHVVVPNEADKDNSKTVNTIMGRKESNITGNEPESLRNSSVTHPQILNVNNV
jgi:hypothetical protein